MSGAAGLPARARVVAVAGLVAVAFVVVAGQLLRLSLGPGATPRIAATEPVVRSHARPDIVDRRGRLIAADVSAPSLYADPQLILDVDEVVDRLTELIPELEGRDLRRQLADRARRFVWIRRGLSPRLAQAVHDLGLPGLAFRNEPRRIYLQGSLAGHLIGHVGFDNQGLAGLERWLDDARSGHGERSPSQSPTPLRLTIDLGVQYGLEAELADIMHRYGASSAAGVILEATTGEVLAAASRPGVDPQRPAEALDPARIDRLAAGSYELGSIMKAVTVAMALEGGLATLDTIYDVRAPLRVGRFTIRDLHPAGRPLSVREIFVHSSNVGAGMIAREAGAERMQQFLARLGLSDPLRTEAGPVAPPRLPRRWGSAEVITVSYGHGIALAPLQFAAAAATLVNGGLAVAPRLVADGPLHGAGGAAPARVISPDTSARIVELMRRNVTHPRGTGRRADVPGLEVGGKTGTAEIPGRGGYQETAVISSFLATWPASRPRYLLLLLVFEPRPSLETEGRITAGLTAAPAAGRLLARIAPLLPLDRSAAVSAAAQP